METTQKNNNYSSFGPPSFVSAHKNVYTLLLEHSHNLQHYEEQSHVIRVSLSSSKINVFRQTIVAVVRAHLSYLFLNQKLPTSHLMALLADTVALAQLVILWFG